MRDISSKEKALILARAAQDKKAQDIVILDMRRVSNFTDYFLICSGGSQRKVRGIAEGILETLKKKGIKVWHLEGYEQSMWILLDYGDVVVHIFYQKIREFYCLERLWGDAPRIE